VSGVITFETNLPSLPLGPRLVRWLAWTSTLDRNLACHRGHLRGVCWPWSRIKPRVRARSRCALSGACSPFSLLSTAFAASAKASGADNLIVRAFAGRTVQR